jgi:hypothetical protein
MVKKLKFVKIVMCPVCRCVHCVVKCALCVVCTAWWSGGDCYYCLAVGQYVLKLSFTAHSPGFLLYKASSSRYLLSITMIKPGASSGKKILNTSTKNVHNLTTRDVIVIYLM